MRNFFVLLTVLILSGCTSFVMSGVSGTDSRTSEISAADTDIERRVTARLSADDIVGAYAIRVRSWNATVTLSGNVGSFAARDRAGAVASGTRGVRAVNNQIMIEEQN